MSKASLAMRLAECSMKEDKAPKGLKKSKILAHRLVRHKKKES